MTEFSIRDEYRSVRKRSPNSMKVERYYKKKYKRLAMNIHDYELPEDLDYTILEKYLFEDGIAIVWKSKTFGYVISRCSVTAWDKNNRPAKFRPQFDTMEAQNVETATELDISEVALFYDTTDPDIKTRDVLVLVDDLIDTRETMRQQVFNQRTPLVAVSGDPSIRKKLKNMIVDIAEGMQVLFMEDDMTNSVKPLDLNAPFNIDRLFAHQMTIENEILEFIGVDATDAPMKKERMLVDEVEGNDELLNYFLTDRLIARQKGIKMMKENLNLDASVEIRTIQRPIMTQDGNYEDEQKYSTLDDFMGGMFS